MSTLSKATLSTLRNNAKSFTVINSEAETLALNIVNALESVIPSKYTKALAGNTLGFTPVVWRDLVSDMVNAQPQVLHAIVSGVTDGVLNGDTYKDYSFDMVDVGGEYKLAEDGAKPDRSLDARQLLALNMAQLKLVPNKKGVNNNPEGTYGPSLERLVKASSKRATCKNAIDKAKSRLLSAIAKGFGSKYGVVVEEVDALDKAVDQTANYFKAQHNKAELMSTDDRKALMAWIVESQANYPLSK